MQLLGDRPNFCYSLLSLRRHHGDVPSSMYMTKNLMLQLPISFGQLPVQNKVLLFCHLFQSVIPPNLSSHSFCPPSQSVIPPNLWSLPICDPSRSVIFPVLSSLPICHPYQSVIPPILSSLSFHHLSPILSSLSLSSLLFRYVTALFSHHNTSLLTFDTVISLLTQNPFIYSKPFELHWNLLSLTLVFSKFFICACATGRSPSTDNWWLN